MTKNGPVPGAVLNRHRERSEAICNCVRPPYRSSTFTPFITTTLPSTTTDT